MRMSDGSWVTDLRTLFTRFRYPLALVILLAAATAFGEPLTEPRSQITDPNFAWSGWYLGGHVGYMIGRANTTVFDLGTNAQASKSSFGMLDGGVQIGYARLLSPQLLLGFETDSSVPNFLANDDRVSFLNTSLEQVEEKIDTIGAVRARFGYALPRGLIYGVGGLAWSLGHVIRNSGADVVGEERWRIRPGWTMGAGFELPVAASWTARVEYRYDHLERVSESFASGTSVASTLGMHSVQLGLNWQIRWPGTEGSKIGCIDNSSVDDDRNEQEPDVVPGSPEKHVNATVQDRDTVSRSSLDNVNVNGKEPNKVPLGPENPINASLTTNAWNIHGQTTFVWQGYPSFHSPYQGANSLSGPAQFRNTVSATAFLGMRLWHGGEFYFNPEIMQGFGLNDVHGVAAFPNGEAQKSSFLVPRFNAARLFLSQTFGIGDEQEIVEDGLNQLAGKRSVSRLTITIGKLAVTDYFLVNSYAGEPRTAFLNWNIFGGGSYDWTMDLLSWTWGALVNLNQKRWALRTGYFLLPVQSNTNYFDTQIPSHGQYVAEFEVRDAPFGKPGKAQLFGWLSHGNIGSYSDALAEPATTANYPDVSLTRGHDRFNYGFVFSAEQSITDDLGVFSRVSWSPERVESMGWTDCGESLSLGEALRGTLWRRPDDTLGIAAVVEGLSPIARRYFAAGGMGILIGDGKLNYRPETVFEVYYKLSPISWAAITPDYQLVINPGYNADRGPVSIFAVRLHAGF